MEDVWHFSMPAVEMAASKVERAKDGRKLRIAKERKEEEEKDTFKVKERQLLM